MGEVDGDGADEADGMLLWWVDGDAAEWMMRDVWQRRATRGISSKVGRSRTRAFDLAASVIQKRAKPNRRGEAKSNPSTSQDEA